MKTEQELMTELGNLLGKENLEALTTQLVARHGSGEKLEGVLMNALTHLDRSFTLEAAGELLDDGQFTDIDRISEWASDGERPQLDFPSHNDESGVERKEDYDNEVGLDFPSMDGD